MSKLQKKAIEKIAEIKGKIDKKIESFLEYNPNLKAEARAYSDLMKKSLDEIIVTVDKEMINKQMQTARVYINHLINELLGLERKKNQMRKEKEKERKMLGQITKEETDKLRYYQADLYHDTLKILACGLDKYGGAKRRNDKKRYWKYIPENSHRVLKAIKLSCEYLEARGKYKEDLKFIDCGCGIGNVLSTAKFVGLKNLYGIEYDEKTYNIAWAMKEILKDGWGNGTKCSVRKGDILNHNGYNKYDIIYYYCPIDDWKLQQKFERKVADTCKKGTIVIGFYSNDTFRKDRRFKQIGDSVFVKLGGFEDVEDDTIKQGDKVILARKGNTAEAYGWGKGMENLLRKRFVVDEIAGRDRRVSLKKPNGDWVAGVFAIEDLDKIRRD